MTTFLFDATGWQRAAEAFNPGEATALTDPIDAVVRACGVGSPEFVQPAPAPRGALGKGCPNSLSKLSGYLADDGSTIDVMVYYTQAAQDAAGGVANIETEIDAAAAYTNQAFENSEIDTRIRIIRKAWIDYAESTSAIENLNRLVEPFDGYIDFLHA